MAVLQRQLRRYGRVLSQPAVLTRDYKLMASYGPRKRRGTTLAEEPKDRIARMVSELPGKPTPAKVSKALGLTDQMVPLLMRGERDLSIEVARKIEATFGYRAAWLVFGALPQRTDDPSEAALEQARVAGRMEMVMEVGAVFGRAIDEVTAKASGALVLGGAARGEAGAGGKSKPKGPTSGPVVESIAEGIRERAGDLQPPVIKADAKRRGRKGG